MTEGQIELTIHEWAALGLVGRHLKARAAESPNERGVWLVYFGEYMDAGFVGYAKRAVARVHAIAKIHNDRRQQQ